MWLLKFAIVVYCSSSINAKHVIERVANEAHDDRLTKVEAILQLVLEKNEELGKQVKHLEARVEDLERERTGYTGQTSNEDRVLENEQDIIESGEHVPKKNLHTSVVSCAPKIKRQLQETTVAFTAMLSHPGIITVGPGQTIVFDKTITNIGSHYHTTTGIFTAPDSGIYVFHISVMVDAGNYEYIELVKDGIGVLNILPSSYKSTNNVTTSKLATIMLMQGSEVWVRTVNWSGHGNGVIHGYSFTTFSGFLNAATK